MIKNNNSDNKIIRNIKQIDDAILMMMEQSIIAREQNIKMEKSFSESFLFPITNYLKDAVQ